MNAATELQAGRGEPLKDTARVLGRYYDCVVWRTYRQSDLEEFAEFAGVPVINGLTDYAHPCQVLADLMTIRERRGALAGQKLCFVGDGSNMANSLIVGGLLSGMKVDCVCPHGYRPAADVLMFAHKYGSAFRLLEDPAEGVKDADVVVTAVWNTAAPGTSESESRLRDFAGFQLTSGLLKAAKPDCMVHHLPALLEIEELNAIQWTPGVGEPQGGSPKWYDLYKKILAGGKSIMACWVTLDELKPLLDNIGADGVHLEMDFHNEREVEQAMRIVEEYSSSSSDVSKEDLSKEEAAATKQETIVVKDSAAAGNEALKPLFNAIVDGKLEPAVEVTKKAIAEGVQPQEIINNYMIKAMGEVGQRFQDGKAFVPQLLMAGRAMKGALELLKPLLQGSASTTIGKVVIGTVKGDLHDIGKNLVASMLEGCGFEVINIGIDVSCDKFVEEVKKNKADILCMSALLTTTMTYMQEVINALEAAGIRHQVKVMIGGAPVSQGFADEKCLPGRSVAVRKEQDIVGVL
jgi:corrinoid protein of di/trimethylamine methyltransferase